MNVIVPCMSWIPICWRDLVGLFYKTNECIDDLPRDIVVIDEPDSVAVDSLDNLFKVDDDLPTVDEPLHDSLIEAVDPLHALADVDIPISKPCVNLPELPDSIVEDILSRLPPKRIFQCQRHSKALRALTKTSYFAQMQLNRSNSVTVVQRYPDTDCEYGFIELYFIDEESHSIETRTVDIGSSYKISIVGSYHGFLLLTNLYTYEEPVYYMWNPVTNEKWTWSLAYLHISYVCGFYFCSLRREYVLLWVSHNGFRYEAHIVNIRTKARKNVGNCSYPPSRGRPPVIINGTLYWMVDQHLYKGIHGDFPSHSHLIVSFEMETERFMEIGHSGRIGASYHENKSLHLFELDGELCMCDPISLRELELSVLNQNTKCWEKRHTVILPRCGVERLNRYWMNKIKTEVVHYKKGELLVRQENTLYACDLHSCTHRIVEIGFADHAFQATVHVDRLVSIAGAG